MSPETSYHTFIKNSGLISHYINLHEKWIWGLSKKKLTFVDSILCARHFTYILSFNPHANNVLCTRYHYSQFTNVGNELRVVKYFPTSYNLIVAGSGLGNSSRLL